MNRHANRPAVGALAVSVWLALCWAAASLAAEGTRQYDVDIQKQPLSEALQEFSRQTQLQYGYLPTDEEEEQLVVGPVKGHLTADAVLALLLPVGFTFEWINPRTISIVSPPVNVPPGGVKETAVAKDRQKSERSKEELQSMANGGGKSGSARAPYAFALGMTVEGKRILDSVFDSLDLDIPATVFDRQDIEVSGASTISDLFRYVTQQPNMKPESYLGEGTVFADLRGLGFDSTLVLINGRRTFPTASALMSNAFDLNNIPLAAVERIEIVSDSTAAIYGTDAIGGIVNVQFRDSVPEPRLDIDYGAAAGGAVERHAAFSASAVGSRARGTVILDYFDRSPLLGRERNRWNNQDFTRFGGIDWRSPTAAPGNVRSTTSANLPGLSSSFAAIPKSSGSAALTPENFVSTAGQRNLESLFGYYGISYSGPRRSVITLGEYKFTPDVRAYGEIMYVDREIMTQFEPPALSGALVSGLNPYNPFGQDVLVDALLTDLGPRTFSRRSETLRAVGGIQGRIGEWEWEGSLQSSHDQAVALRTGELDPMRVGAALTASELGTALNLFGANSSALLASLLAEPSRSRYRTEGIQSVASVRGPLTSLPAGAVELALGGEWREEAVRYVVAPPLNVAGSHQRSVVAAFMELRVPLVNEEAGVPALHSLALVLSGRLDDYSDVGNAFNPEYALIWRPMSALTLRTSLSRSFRPPPLADLHVPTITAPALILDPARNNEFAFLSVRAGGNPELQSSEADSLSLGLKFEPKGPSELRLGANYWRIDIDDTIAVPSPGRLLAAERLFPERVFRALPTSGDLAAGIPGPLQLIDVRRLNFGSVRTSGVDASAAITIATPIGRFKPKLSATWVHDYTTSDLVAGPDVTRVGTASLQGTIPRWNAVATIDWSQGGFGLSGAMRYVPSYEDVDFLGNRNGRSVPSQAIVDAQLSFDLGEAIGKRSPWNGFEIRAGAFNLFNAQPPFAEVGGLLGYDTTQADLKQRFAYLKVAKKF
jgi:iron complex outermembrane recepter protein